MKTTSASLSINNIILKYAFFAVSLYIIYFFLMKFIGLIYLTELRFLNYGLYFIAGYYALKTASTQKDNKFTYLQGLGIAFIVGALSFVLFALFAFVYSFFNSFFVDTILLQYPSANSMGRFVVPFLIAAEGIGFSVIFSLCLMQFFRIYTGRLRKTVLSSEGEIKPVSVE
ncbi:MAG: hypothetical protein ABI855_01950 [Bacteroidota bacterium]